MHSSEAFKEAFYEYKSMCSIEENKGYLIHPTSQETICGILYTGSFKKAIIEMSKATNMGIERCFMFLTVFYDWKEYEKQDRANMY